MEANQGDETASAPLEVEVHPTNLHAEPSTIPDAIAEDEELLKYLETEFSKREARLLKAQQTLNEQQATLQQAETRQETAHRLYTLSKNMMDQIKREGQLKSSQKAPRDESSRHGRSLSSMDQSRQALVDRTITTLRDAISELQAATSDLTIARRNVATADAFVKYSHRSLRAVGYLRSVTKGFIDDEYSATRPTPQLPETVWRMIFASAVADDSLLPLEPRDKHKEWSFRCTPLVLSHVSKEWRRIATSTPGLWTNVQVVYTTEKSLRSALFHRLVGLSTGSPLNIVVTLTTDIGNVVNQLTSAFTEDHRVQTIACQVSDDAAPSLRSLLDVIPASQNLYLRGLSIDAGPISNTVKLPTKHVMSATNISVYNILLERQPPFFLVPPPPWHLHTLRIDLVSLFRIDINGSAPSLQRITITHPPTYNQIPPWYENAIGPNVENVAATELIVHPMSRSHLIPLVKYLSRLKQVKYLEICGGSVQPILTMMKDNVESDQPTWLPALSELVISDYEQHGTELGLYVAKRLTAAQESLKTGTQRVQPLTRFVVNRSPNISTDIVGLIEQHCKAGQEFNKVVTGDTESVPPQSS
ncbi:hypothetical protein FRC17_010347 [Serendipita sp. 399]|nr:hypothetical protein FRC17_010347 [Serendipita sp. 399]